MKSNMQNYNMSGFNPTGEDAPPTKNANRIPFGYLFIALGMLLTIGLALIIVLGSVFSSRVLVAVSVEEQAIVQRTLEVTEDQEAINRWTAELEAGQLSLSDFVSHIFTGTDYLLLGKDDGAFAQDLAYSIYGNREQAKDFVQSLSGTSRVYVIEQLLRALNADYAPMPKDSNQDKTGTQIQDVKLDQALQNEDGYAFGVRKVSGQISMTGSAARLDFYIDRNLRPAKLDFMGDAGGQQDFSMLWDTRGEVSGKHDVAVLLRTSDGRARLLSGGSILVPAFNTLTNNSISQSFLPQDENDVWYELDAEEQNAYINFVDLSADVAVSLYDIYGNLIGKNDLPDSKIEALRGKKQDLPELDKEDIYVAPLANVFYARVQRTDITQKDQISYFCVQSKEVAVNKESNYLAVLSDVGIVPTPIPTVSISDEEKNKEIICQDLSGDHLSYPQSELSFLPINGRLNSLLLESAESKQNLSYYPAFSTATNDYGYVATQGLSSIATKATMVEGYAAQVKVQNEAEAGQVIQMSEDGALGILPSRNKVQIIVTDFDSVEHIYNLYLLSGTDSQGYDKATLNLFPESYKSGVWLLHNLRPDYQIIPQALDITWQEIVDNQDNKDKSLAMYDDWVKKDSPVYDGTTWRAATREIVKYFLDPRNFLGPVNIFQFEKLSFDGSVHTLDGLRAMVKGSFLEATDPDYAAILLKAGQEANVSPYFLASRILQEMGRNGESKLAHGSLEGYEGYYNFYNIGSTPDPSVTDGALINGAKYAQWGSNSSTKVLSDDAKALLLPWTSPELAIRGGALWIARSYIEIGQDTLYFQKFDVINNEDGLYKHQYAQNISMAYSEGIRYYMAYRSQNMLDSQFMFVVPIYKDMPPEITAQSFRWH